MYNNIVEQRWHNQALVNYCCFVATHESQWKIETLLLPNLLLMYADVSGMDDDDDDDDEVPTLFMDRQQSDELLRENKENECKHIGRREGWREIL